MRQSAVLVLVACLAWSPGGPARAQETRELDAIQRALEQGRAERQALKGEVERLKAERAALRTKMIAAARAAQEREALVALLSEQLRELGADSAERRDALVKRRAELSATLQALYGLSRQPPQAFLFYPGPPLEAVRSSILLREAVPALDRQARQLRGELAALSAVQRDLAGKLERLREAEAALRAEQAALARLIEEKKAVEQNARSAFETANDRVLKLSRQARSLKELVDRLDEAPAADPAPADAEEASVAALTSRPPEVRAFPDRGPITTPVVGRLVQRYGANTGLGQTSRGVVLETGAAASVVAPYDGRVAFAGPFRDHGQILIIEHDGAYHTVLAGLELVNAVVGQWVLAGEPVGTMQRSDTANVSAKGVGEARPRLYIELRRDGQPVNPLRWIRPSNSKVREG